MPLNYEAFMLMRYQCEVCGSAERIWNSRDGVAPLYVGCRVCGEPAKHVRWHEDVYAPSHNPRLGDRYFRDGLISEAHAIMRERIKQMRSTYPVSDEEEKDLINSIGTEDDTEFRPGWPHLVMRGTNADTLPLS